MVIFWLVLFLVGYVFGGYILEAIFLVKNGYTFGRYIFSGNIFRVIFSITNIFIRLLRLSIEF